MDYRLIYLRSVGKDKADFIACEACNAPAVDIHHIKPKGMGGSKTKNYPANLIALCRECHVKAHSNREFNISLRKIATERCGKLNDKRF